MSETTQKEFNGTANDSKSPKGKQLSSFCFYTVQASARQPHNIVIYHVNIVN